MELEPGSTAHITLQWNTRQLSDLCINASSMTIMLNPEDWNYFLLNTLQWPMHLCQTVEISDYEAGIYPGTPIPDKEVQHTKLTATPVAVEPSTPNPRKILVEATEGSSLQTNGCPELYLYGREADSKTYLTALHRDAKGEYTADPDVPEATTPCAAHSWPAPITVLDNLHDAREQTAVVWRAIGEGGRKVFVEASYRLVQNNSAAMTTEEDVYSRCQKYVQTPIPEADKLSESSLNTLDCNSEALYDGVDEAQDYRKARACAYRERDAGLDQVTPFRGADILAMIYANGEGVPQNLSLARRFTCETVGRDTYQLLSELPHTEQTTLALQKASADAALHFDICDTGDVGSPEEFAECDARSDLIDESHDAAKVMPMATTWPTAQRYALREMLRAAFVFFKDRTAEYPDKVADNSGLVDSNHAVNHEEDELLKSLQTLEAVQMPPVSNNAHFTAVNASLNEVLRAALRRAPEEYKDSNKYQLTRDSLRQTQRAWIKYRDAWVSFGLLRYPKTTEDVWKTWITEKRLMELRALQSLAEGAK